jgi:hypothetical protein
MMMMMMIIIIIIIIIDLYGNEITYSLMRYPILPRTGFEYSFIFMPMLSKPAPLNFCVIPVRTSL